MQAFTIVVEHLAGEQFSKVFLRDVKRIVGATFMSPLQFNTPTKNVNENVVAEFTLLFVLSSNLDHYKKDV